jgi:hypothetical protein
MEERLTAPVILALFRSMRGVPASRGRSRKVCGPLSCAGPALSGWHGPTCNMSPQQQRSTCIGWRSGGPRHRERVPDSPHLPRWLHRAVREFANSVNFSRKIPAKRRRQRSPGRDCRSPPQRRGAVPDPRTVPVPTAYPPPSWCHYACCDEFSPTTPRLRSPTEASRPEQCGRPSRPSLAHVDAEGSFCVECSATRCSRCVAYYSGGPQAPARQHLMSARIRMSARIVSKYRCVQPRPIVSFRYS